MNELLELRDYSWIQQTVVLRGVNLTIGNMILSELSDQWGGKQLY
ncbi:MAG: hypothetical protein ACLTZT_16380 [Butyricimonas faecalis]